MFHLVHVRGGHSNWLPSTTTSVEALLPPMVMVPQGGVRARVWFAESATPAIELRRTICHRMYGLRPIIGS